MDFGFVTILIFAVVLLSCLGTILGVSYMAYQAISSNSWPFTTGTIIESELAETIQDSGLGAMETVPVPGITYTYMVYGEKLQGKQTNFQIKFCSYSKKEAQRVLDRYPLNSKVKVYFNPRNPSNAVLETGPTIGSYCLIIIGIVALIIIVFCIIGIIKVL